MPYRPHTRRPLPVTMNPLQLCLSIALGLWLGFVAIALTCWLLSSFVFQAQLAPVANAVRQLSQPPAPVAEPPAANPMFEQYKENLYKNEQQQRLDQVRNDPRNLNNATCQFWLAQDQNAPSEKSRTNVLQFCK